VKWLADECFDNDIIRGLLRRSPDFDLVRVQDIAEVAGGDDETLLAWAGRNDRVVLTHDLATMVPALGFSPCPGSSRLSLCLIRSRLVRSSRMFCFSIGVRRSQTGLPA
jgi:hypothetical protein